MKRWLRRIRGAVGMGLTWAVGWTVIGMLIMVVTYTLFPDLPEADVWVPVFALPGFLGGVAFSGVLGITGRRRRFDELSLPQFAAWGAIGGLLLGLIPAAAVAEGTASVAQAATMVAAVILMSAGSAAGSLALARRADDRELFEVGEDVADVGLTGDEARKLLGKV